MHTHLYNPFSNRNCIKKIPPRHIWKTNLQFWARKSKKILFVPFFGSH